MPKKVLEPIELPEVEFSIQDGIFIKQMYMYRSGIYVPQHSHKYSHSSMLARGSVRCWKDGKLFGDFTAPTPINIDAGVKHTFMSLEPDTIIYCIHRTDRTGEVEIKDNHELNIDKLGG